MTKKLIKSKDFDLCECGHIRRHHYEGKGTCDESHSGIFLAACRCSRYKKAKDQAVPKSLLPPEDTFETVYVRLITTNGVTYLRAEDVVKLLLEVAGGFDIDDKNQLTKLAASLDV